MNSLDVAQAALVRQRRQATEAGVQSLTRRHRAEDRAQPVWLIEVPQQHKPGKRYPTNSFGPLEMTGLRHLAMTFVAEADARAAAAMLRDEECLFEDFETVLYAASAAA